MARCPTGHQAAAGFRVQLGDGREYEVRAVLERVAIILPLDGSTGTSTVLRSLLAVAPGSIRWRSRRQPTAEELRRASMLSDERAARTPQPVAEPVSPQRLAPVRHRAVPPPPAAPAPPEHLTPADSPPDVGDLVILVVELLDQASVLRAQRAELREEVSRYRLGIRRVQARAAAAARRAR